MPRKHGLLVSGVVALTGALALADPATPELLPVKTHMEGTFGQDLSDVRSHTDSGMQAQAVRRSLKALRRDSDGLFDDVRTLKRIAGWLERAFPDEFSAPPVKVSLGDVIDAALDGLTARVGTQRDTLAGQVGGLPELRAGKVQRLIDKADARLADADAADTRRRRAKLLFNGTRFLVKGARKAGSP